jgi:hypothetical protein
MTECPVCKGDEYPCETCGRDADKKPPSTLQEVLEQNRALVAAAPPGVREVYKMNREFEARSEAASLERMMDPRLDPVQMTKEAAVARIGNLVYEATALFERLEGADLVWGNGHHARQKIAAFAQHMIAERWRGPTEEEN